MDMPLGKKILKNKVKESVQRKKIKDGLSD